MKTKFKKIIAATCIAATMCSVAAMSASALTRRLYGDVNGDGIISNADVTLIQQYSMDLTTLDQYQIIAADVDGDGSVTLRDAYMVKRLLEGVGENFPVGDYFIY